MRRSILGALLALCCIAGSAQAQGPFGPRRGHYGPPGAPYGSYYQQPYGGFIPRPVLPYGGGFYGGPYYSSPYRPLYRGYYGPYSPSPPRYNYPRPGLYIQF